MNIVNSLHVYRSNQSWAIGWAMRAIGISHNWKTSDGTELAHVMRERIIEMTLEWCPG